MTIMARLCLCSVAAAGVLLCTAGVTVHGEGQSSDLAKVLEDNNYEALQEITGKLISSYMSSPGLFNPLALLEQWPQEIIEETKRANAKQIIEVIKPELLQKMAIKPAGIFWHKILSEEERQQFLKGTRVNPDILIQLETHINQNPGLDEKPLSLREDLLKIWLMQMMMEIEQGQDASRHLPAAFPPQGNFAQPFAERTEPYTHLVNAQSFLTGLGKLSATGFSKTALYSNLKSYKDILEEESSPLTLTLKTIESMVAEDRREEWRKFRDAKMKAARTADAPEEEPYNKPVEKVLFIGVEGLLENTNSIESAQKIKPADVSTAHVPEQTSLMPVFSDEAKLTTEAREIPSQILAGTPSRDLTAPENADANKEPAVKNETSLTSDTHTSATAARMVPEADIKTTAPGETVSPLPAIENGSLSDTGQKDLTSVLGGSLGLLAENNGKTEAASADPLKEIPLINTEIGT